MRGNQFTEFNTCALYIAESERKQEGDGFDQVGTNPCNSKYLCLES